MPKKLIPDLFKAKKPPSFLNDSDSCRMQSVKTFQHGTAALFYHGQKLWTILIRDSECVPLDNIMHYEIMN